MKIRFATFNLFQFVEPPYSWYIRKDRFKIEQFEEKKTWIKEQIQNMNCDIIGFQEVFSKECLKELLKSLGFNYFTTVDTAKTRNPNSKTYISTTVALASKYPIKETKEIDLYIPTLKKHNFEGHFRFSRKPINAIIELPNKQKIRVYYRSLIF